MKAAALQGDEAEDRYLLLVREAVMTRRLNVARREVLLQLGDELAAGMPRALRSHALRRRSRPATSPPRRSADLQRVRFLGIGRFPTIVVHGANGSRIAVGYRPVDVMERIFQAVSEEG